MKYESYLYFNLKSKLQRVERSALAFLHSEGESKAISLVMDMELHGETWWIKF